MPVTIETSVADTQDIPMELDESDTAQQGSPTAEQTKTLPDVTDQVPPKTDQLDTSGQVPPTTERATVDYRINDNLSRVETQMPAVSSVSDLRLATKDELPSEDALNAGLQALIDKYQESAPMLDRVIKQHKVKKLLSAQASFSYQVDSQMKTDQKEMNV